MPSSLWAKVSQRLYIPMLNKHLLYTVSKKNFNTPTSPSTYILPTTKTHLVLMFKEQNTHDIFKQEHRSREGNLRDKKL